MMIWLADRALQCLQGHRPTSMRAILEKNVRRSLQVAYETGVISARLIHVQLECLASRSFTWRPRRSMASRRSRRSRQLSRARSMPACTVPWGATWRPAPHPRTRCSGSITRTSTGSGPNGRSSIPALSLSFAKTSSESLKQRRDPPTVQDCALCGDGLPATGIPRPWISHGRTVRRDSGWRTGGEKAQVGAVARAFGGRAAVLDYAARLT